MKCHFFLLAFTAFAVLQNLGCNKQPNTSAPGYSMEDSSQTEAQDANAKSDGPGDLPGLAVGSKAPTFSLQDQFGETQSLTTLLMNGPVALVFYRSADW